METKGRVRNIRGLPRAGWFRELERSAERNAECKS